MRWCDYYVVLALLLHFLKAELIVVRKQDEVYCMESSSSNKALTWIPTIEKNNKNVSYKEEVKRLPTKDTLEEFRHLNCDLMQEGACPLAEKHTKSWEIIDHASGEYGFISDHRWHALPMYNTSGEIRELQQIPATINGKTGQIHLSILAKNSAIITVTDGKRGYIIIKLDAYVKSMAGKRQSLSYCPKNISKNCNEKEITSKGGSILNDGERWANVKMVIKQISNNLLITINNTENPVFWNVPCPYKTVNYDNFQVKNLYITTTNQQMGFWKFHDYRVLRQKHRSQVLTLDFETRNNPQLCLSILYHSGGVTTNVPIAATLTIASNTTDYLQAGEKWQEYRRVFKLKANTRYQMSLIPMNIYSLFAIGEVRVCQEREYSVTKMKINHEKLNVTCTIFNENETIIESKLEDLQFNSFIYACPKDSFGENCDIPCSEFGEHNCKSLRVCNATMCSCMPGYNGTNCEDECQGNYGPGCKLPCKHCRNGSQCNFVSGACPNADCEDGYMPGQDALCKDECLNGTYGRNCEQNCSAYCPIANQCNHTDGSCTRDNCSVEIYEPPTCQYPRITLSESPKFIKSGIDTLKLSFPKEGILDDIRHLVHQVGVQYRLHEQTTAEWHEGVRLSFSDALGEITLSGLTPKTIYDIRVILYDERGNGNFGDKVPVLSAVTTLCKPAGKSGLQVEPEGKTIKVKINTMKKNEECNQPSDYVISICGTDEYISLNEDLAGHSTELEYVTLYTVEITASDIVHTFKVMTEKEPSTIKFIIGGLLLLILVLIVFIVVIWCYNNGHKLKKERNKVIPTVTELEIKEIDLRKPVAAPRWKLPQRDNGDPGYIGVLEPYQYDVVREPRPLWPWLKRFSRLSVDQDGYAVPLSRGNKAESSRGNEAESSHGNKAESSI